MKTKQDNISLILALILIMSSVIISSCSAGGTPNEAIEKYLQALANKDEVSAVNLSCAEWEEQALAEGASFKTVEVSLENLSCQVDTEDSDLAMVSCTGRYVFSYDAGEDQELDLEGRTFKVAKESGEWRMCGYGK